jgi:uncharacterized protein with von Willebrand factor type A (vWA) domain
MTELETLNGELRRLQAEAEVAQEVIASQRDELDLLRTQAALVPGLKREVARLKQELGR